MTTSIVTKLADPPGLYFAIDEAGDTTVTLGVHLDTQHFDQVVLPLPLQEGTSRPRPKWYQDIKTIRDMHDTRDENRGHTYVRLYGLANSALNDQTAACISTHPNDAVEYAILAAQSTTLIISGEDTSHNSSALPHEVCAEALYPYIVRALGNTADGPLDFGALSLDMLRITGLARKTDDYTVDVSNDHGILLDVRRITGPAAKTDEPTVDVYNNHGISSDMLPFTGPATKTDGYTVDVSNDRNLDGFRGQSLDDCQVRFDDFGAVLSNLYQSSIPRQDAGTIEDYG